MSGHQTEPPDAVCECGHLLSVHQGPGESCGKCYSCEEFRSKPKPFDRNFWLALALGLAYPWLLVWKHGFGGDYVVFAVGLTALWAVAVIADLVRLAIRARKARHATDQPSTE